jgi:hypothetical protein
MDADTGTHKNEDPISIFLPALDFLVVGYLCSLGVYGEERPRAVAEVGFSSRWLIRRRLRVEAVKQYMRCRIILNIMYFIMYYCIHRYDKVKRCITYLLRPLQGRLVELQAEIAET